MILIYLSPVPWNSIAQRPHFFAKSVLDNQSVDKVYWVEPTPSRLPKLSDIRRLFSKIEPTSFSLPADLTIINTKYCIPLEPLPKLFKLINYFFINSILSEIDTLYSIHKKENIILVVGKPSILALTILEKYQFRMTIADIMDDFPYFFKGISRISMQNMMFKLMQKVKQVWFSSYCLEKKYSKNTYSHKVILNAASSMRHRKKGNKLRSKIIYGYIGSINRWFDWSFIIKLAYSRPKSEIWIIGPKYIPSPSLPSNVMILPAVEHNEIEEYLNYFSYGIIPFKINELTNSVDPVKYYEYITYHIPVISTEFGEMKRRINEGYACSLEQHLAGKTSNFEKNILWKDRFTEELFNK